MQGWPTNSARVTFVEQAKCGTCQYEMSQSIRGRWRRCMELCVGINFKVSHTFREDNNYVDKLVNWGVDNKLEFFLYFVMLPCLSLNFLHNRYQFLLFHV